MNILTYLNATNTRSFFVIIVFFFRYRTKDTRVLCSKGLSTPLNVELQINKAETVPAASVQIDAPQPCLLSFFSISFHLEVECKVWRTCLVKISFGRARAQTISTSTFPPSRVSSSNINSLSPTINSICGICPFVTLIFV